MRDLAQMRTSDSAISIALYTRDSILSGVLSSGLGGEFTCVRASSEEDLRRIIEEEPGALVVFDMSSSRGGREQAASCVKLLLRYNCVVILLADRDTRQRAEECVQAGAFACCQLPPSIHELRVTLRRAHDSVIRTIDFGPAEARPKAHAIDRVPMVGESIAMRELARMIERVANIDAPVLIVGESGTGKELAARAIHKSGNRAGLPFVAVACGAIPETLIESELFGHEKGAFTGSVGARQGFFEQADRGTLFLDEIGELSLFTQVKLLRVLQEREFNRLGSGRGISLRARAIFATHRDLNRMVADGTFRQDLYYRVNVIKIETPPLREHPEDIPQIAMYFVRKYSELFQKEIRSIAPEVIAILQEYPWPGNVRELENVVQRSIIVARDDTLRCVDLPRNLHEEAVTNDIDCQPGGSFERQVLDYKIRLVERALRSHNGNRSLAAGSLGISRGYLHRLLRLSTPVEIASSMLAEPRAES